MCSISIQPFLIGKKHIEYVEDFDVYIAYEYNEILLALMFMRVYLPGRFYMYLTEYMNPRTQRVCLINGCNFNTMFAFKSLIKEKPVPFFGTALGISILILGYNLRIFESPLSEISGEDFTSYQNSMWNMIITITSAGYGDF
jgi:hypothetical protein